MGADRRTLPVHLVVNPRSGYGGRKLMVAELRAAARSAGIDLIEHTTTGPGDAAAYTQGLAGQAGGIIVWGGDGTVSEIAGSLAGTDVPVLPCPAGTENLLAKELRTPADPQKVIDVFLNGYEVPCDVGVINGRAFLLIIGIGFDGEVVRRLSTGRTGHISHLSYFWPIWRTVWEHRFPRMRVVADGEEIFDDYALAFIGNISRYAVGLRICRDAVFDDGLLDLVVFTCREQTRLALHAAWTLLRMHPQKGNVIYRQVRQVRFETDGPVPSQVDGDVGPDTPLDISVSPRRLRLLVPRRRYGLGLWPWKGESIA